MLLLLANQQEMVVMECQEVVEDQVLRKVVRVSKTLISKLLLTSEQLMESLKVVLTQLWAMEVETAKPQEDKASQGIVKWRLWQSHPQ